MAGGDAGGVGNLKYQDLKHLRPESGTLAGCILVRRLDPGVSLVLDPRLLSGNPPGWRNLRPTGGIAAFQAAGLGDSDSQAVGLGQGWCAVGAQKGTDGHRGQKLIMNYEG